jgi:hypothetical protein
MIAIINLTGTNHFIVIIEAELIIIPSNFRTLPSYFLFRIINIQTLQFSKNSLISTEPFLQITI